MELQISYSVCAEVYKKSIFLEKETSSREDTTATMLVERRKHNRGRNLPRSCTYVSGDTTKDKCKFVYGVLERKKQHNAV